ncbi:MAG: hypothetical protein ACR2QM_09285 [Longimicrobiales bacterium]
MKRMTDCSEVRGHLGPGGGKLHPALVTQLEEHVRACEECRDYLALDPVLLQAYEQLRGEEAPEKVHHQVRGALRALEQGGPALQSVPVPARRSRKVVLWPAVPLLAAAGLAAVLMARVPEAPAPPSTAFVEDYVRRATAAGEHVTTSDPAEVTAFLEARLGVRLEPLVFEGLVVEGAEVCLLDGERGALILYKMDGVIISHYLIPHDQAVERGPAVGQVAQEMAGGSEGDVNLVTWASPKLEQALMGTAPTGTMVDLARQAGIDQ